jgi:hypothetical protein
MNVLNFEAHRRKRLRELLSSAFRGQLPQDEGQEELRAWRKEMERRTRREWSPPALGLSSRLCTEYLFA